MKSATVLFFLIFFICTISYSQGVYINELDYDIPGTDNVEFIELVGPVSTNLNGYQLILVNGLTGAEYNTINLNGFLIPNDNINGYGFFVIAPSGYTNVDFTPTGWEVDEIQNGTPDGILLKKDGIVVDGFSYEGTISNNADFTSGMSLLPSENNASPNLSIGRLTLGFDNTDQSQFFASNANTPSPGEVNTAHGQSDQSLPVQLNSFTASAGENGNRTEHGPISATPRANITEQTIDNRVPQAFYLKNYPNPFNPSTKIAFDISAHEQDVIPVRLNIYNALGQRVRTLVDAGLSAKAYVFPPRLTKWNGTVLMTPGISFPAEFTFTRFRPIRSLNPEK